jgi:hypothetical protein
MERSESIFAISTTLSRRIQRGDQADRTVQVGKKATDNAVTRGKKDDSMSLPIVDFTG